MPTQSLLPDKQEVRAWLISTLQHSTQMEYYMERLGIGKEDPEHPHDIIGPCNKYDWPVITGLAMQYRQPFVVVEKYLKESLALHRQQYHHRMWNGPNTNASQDAMMVGALDAICSLRENRRYQDGIHTWEEIAEIAQKNPPHKTPWMLKTLDELQKIEPPRLDEITTVECIPNIGLRKNVYEDILARTYSAIARLTAQGRL